MHNFFLYSVSRRFSFFSVCGLMKTSHCKPFFCSSLFKSICTLVWEFSSLFFIPSVFNFAFWRVVVFFIDCTFYSVWMGIWGRLCFSLGTGTMDQLKKQHRNNILEKIVCLLLLFFFCFLLLLEINMEDFLQIEWKREEILPKKKKKELKFNSIRFLDQEFNQFVTCFFFKSW